MNEYGFDPKFILKSLVTIYLAFREYKEFLEFIVGDERSFKMENFEKVIQLREAEKITLDYEIFQEYKAFVDQLYKVKEEMKENQVNILFNI